MKKQEILDLGVNEETAKQIMILHGKDIQAEQGKTAEVKEELESTKELATSHEKELGKLKKALEGNEDAQNQVAALQKQLHDSNKAHESEMQQLKTDNAIGSALRDAGARDIKAVLPFIDKDTIKYEDGKLTGLSEQMENIQKDHDYLFEANETQETPQGVHITAAGNPGSTQTQIDPSSMSYQDLLQAKQSNPDQFESAINADK